MNEIIPGSAIKEGLKQYRKDVPSVGTVSFEDSQQYLADGIICRGWTILEGKKRYFHVIRSPQEFPKKTFMVAESEKELFSMTVMLGMEAGIEFDLLVNENQSG